MKLEELEKKLAELRKKLLDIDPDEAEITKKRTSADMGDDYRENEGAKHVMEQHDIWYIRKVALKKEILAVKQAIIRECKNG